jgi:hypothetical protein
VETYGQLVCYVEGISDIFFQRKAHSEELKKGSDQQSISFFVKPIYDHKHPKQKLVTDTVVDFIAEDLMPLHVVDTVWFQSY